MNELKKFGRYEVSRVLGSGSMGVVYEGIDSRLNRRVAIKTIHKNALIDPDQATDYSTRFMREAQSVARLNHPNIVTVYDFGEEGDIAYFVMEFIEGKELKNFFDIKTAFPLNKALSLIINLLDALGYAHSQGIIHRDIKPANIMIDKAGRLKLTDFGVARVFDNNEGTKAGTIVGTPSYMSPEQIEGSVVGPGSDIFAVGVILYQFLTRQKPFSGATTFDIQRKIINDFPVKPSSIDPDLSPFLDQIVSKALAKDPKQRYLHTSEFADDLKQVLATGSMQKIADSTSPDIEKTIVLITGEHDKTTGNEIMVSNDKNTAVDLTSLLPSGASAAAVNQDRSQPPTKDDTGALRDKKDDTGSIKEGRSKTIICSVLFLDIVGYSKVSGFEQISLKKNFNDLLSASIQNTEPDGMIVLDTGDGAALNFLSDVEAPLRIAIHMCEVLIKSGEQMNPPLQVRMGINLGPGHLVKDINGRQNIVGDVINVAQRVMGFAGINQILVSRSYFDSVSHLSPEYETIFQDFGSHSDKHVREHAVYAVIFPLDSTDAGQASAANYPAALKLEALPDDQKNKINSKPGFITRLFKSIFNFFKNIFGFFMSMLKIILGVVRFAILVAVIVVLLVLGSKYLPTSNIVEGQIGDLWKYASAQVDKGLQAVGIDTGKSAGQDAGQDAGQGAAGQGAGHGVKRPKGLDPLK